VEIVVGYGDNIVIGHHFEQQAPVFGVLVRIHTKDPAWKITQNDTKR
jgi:hypothetical protein